jgi:O-antigen/teichoic acid export membrane protein
MTVLCLAMLVNLAAGNVGTVLLMGGRSTWVLMDKGAALAVNVAANVALVPHFGITGAAVAWAVTIVGDSVLAFGQVRWGMRIGGSLRGLVLAGLLALGCFAVVPVAVRMVAGSSLPAMSVAIALSLALYLPMVWVRRDSLGIPVLMQALSRRTRHN